MAKEGLQTPGGEEVRRGKSRDSAEVGRSRALPEDQDVAIFSGVREQCLEGAKERAKNLHERLSLDWNNDVMDYSRMNFVEVFTVFNCDTRHSITHWRIAKIMDGISICSEQLGICSSISPNSIPEKIYQPLMTGKADEKSWKVKVKNPKTGEEKEFDASLADFAHFVDVTKANRELVGNRVSMENLVYNYFSGKKEIKVNIGEEDDKEKEIDLLDAKFNPRDDYGEIDTKGYLEFMKRPIIQAGLQLLTRFRYTSGGHREIAGQALQIKGETGAVFVPLSGRMAARLTLSDMQKQEKEGMMGQPQEVAEVDELETGAFIRFNLADLVQRRRGGDIRNVQKTDRMKKAMCGLTLVEDAYSQIKTIAGDNGKELHKIYLCGEKQEGKIIDGILGRYGKQFKRTTGKELSRKEASDVAMTDVFIPCILNNPNDWLSALADAYGVGGGRGALSLIQNRESFIGFDINVYCRDVETPGHPITLHTFKGFNDLWLYVQSRVRAGHIDQPNVEKFVVNTEASLSSLSKDKRAESTFFLSSIDENQGNLIFEIFDLLKIDKKEVQRYVKDGGEKAELELSASDVSGLEQVNKETVAQLDELRKQSPVGFGAGVASRLKVMMKEAVMEGKLGELLERFFALHEFDDQDSDAVIDGFALTLHHLNERDRKLIKAGKK